MTSSHKDRDLGQVTWLLLSSLSSPATMGAVASSTLSQERLASQSSLIQ